MQRKAQKRDQLYETLKAAISGGQYASGKKGGYEHAPISPINQEVYEGIHIP